MSVASTVESFGKPRRHQILPGFGLTMGYAVTYLSLIVLIPLAAAFVSAGELSPAKWLHVLLTPRVLAAFRLSIIASLVAAAINAVFGLLIAWVLTRYEFPGRRLLDALVDLPFALPTAVAGIALTTLYAPNGWLGRILEPLGIHVAFTPLGVVVALTFIGLPFVVRTLQPVLADLDQDLERAAETLGARPTMVFRRIIFPALLPALVTGSALAFSRALGEYGSVIFIAGNIPLVSEIVPLVIMTKLEQFQYAEAAVVAVAMLLLSFAMMFVINGAQLRIAATPPGKTMSRHDQYPGSDATGRLLGRVVLVSIAVLYLGLFLVLPLITVFVQAFAKGVAAYWHALLDADALAAMRMTLTVAAISVPLNTVFGTAAAWAVSKYRLSWQGFVADANRPAICRVAGDRGHDLRADFWRP